MSREIKFRAFDNKEKKYLYPENQGFIIVPTRPSFGVTLPYENCSNPDNIDEDCFDWADADLLTGRYELEQYAGLKDKNGKEIYEGDIIDFFGEKYPVIYRAGGFWAEYSKTQKDHLFLYAIDSEVIGNIHENPELLGD